MWNIRPITLLCYSSTILASTCILPLPGSSYSYSIPSWLSLNYSCTGSPQVWQARPSPGKGIGVFATRTLEPGDTILAEPPIIRIQPPGFRDGARYPLTPIEPLLYTVFENLTREQQDEVLALHAHMTARETEDMVERGKHDPLSRLMPIFRSNAYIVGSAMSELGLFPKGARINHSCRPNSSQVWVEKTGKRVVRAIRKIEEGEEIFATYIPLLHSRQTRQERLQQYGFTCTCSACSAPHHQIEASDIRREDIRRVFNDFEPQLSLNVPESVMGRKRAERNVEAGVQLAGLVEEEGLADYYAQAYRIVALSYGRIEEWEAATLWAHRSYELRKVADESAEGTVEMKRLLEIFIGSWNAVLYNTSKREA